MTSQRETLLRATDNAEAVNAHADDARGLLRTMMGRALGNKILLGVTVLILLLGNGVFLYFQFQKDKAKV